MGLNIQTGKICDLTEVGILHDSEDLQVILQSVKAALTQVMNIIVLL